MKIAVCIGGQQRNIPDFSYSILEKRMFHAFRNVEADYYYQTWNINTLNDRERATREKAEAAEKARKDKDRKKAAEKRKLKADAEYAEYERLKAKFEVEETK